MSTAHTDGTAEDRSSGFLETKKITVGDLSVRYADMGKGPSMVLIHGFPETLQGWRRVAPRLSPSFRVLAPDVVGFGSTDKPAIDYTPQELAKFVKDFMEAVGVSRAHIVGTDTGQGIAVAFAGMFPERTDRLVLSAGTIYGDDMESWEVAAMNMWGVGELIIYSPFVGAIVSKSLKKGLVDERLVDERFRDECRDALCAAGGRRAALRMIRSFGREEKFMVECLKKIRAPTLVIFADKDCYFPEAGGRRLAGEIPGARFELIRDCGHFLQEEKPEEYSRLVLEFLREGGTGSEK